MLGLWSLGTVALGLILHLAFDVALGDLLDAPERLKKQGIKPLFLRCRDNGAERDQLDAGSLGLLPRSERSCARVLDHAGQIDSRFRMNEWANLFDRLTQ
jgi:hypothetical protein